MTMLQKMKELQWVAQNRLLSCQIALHLTQSNISTYAKNYLTKSHIHVYSYQLPNSHQGTHAPLSTWSLSDFYSCPCCHPLPSFKPEEAKSFQWRNAVIIFTAAGVEELLFNCWLPVIFPLRKKKKEKHSENLHWIIRPRVEYASDVCSDGNIAKPSKLQEAFSASVTNWPCRHWTYLTIIH